MYISMNWIGDFVDLSGLDLEALIHRFTLSTAEVEDVYQKGEDLRDVVAGKILSVENHPDSKKLHLLKVDGGDKIYDVVCGAPNVREGMIVPFVKEGGMVAGQEITCATIAGCESQGMCCSEKELGISYPTVKKNLETIIRKMGFEVKKKSAQQEMLEKIRNGELTVDEAITQIKTNQEKED